MENFIASDSGHCWSARVFRTVGLIASCLLLLAATFTVWRHRFEPVPGARTLRLEDFLRNAPDAAEGRDERTTLDLTAAPGSPPVVRLYPLPGIRDAAFLRVRMRYRAIGLQRGREVWDDGRLILDWHSTGQPGQPEHDALATCSGDQADEPREIVCRPRRSPATPVLRFENRGTSGTLRIERFDVLPVRETALWRYGRFGLAAAWWLWATLVTATARRRPGIPQAFAGALWLVAASQFILPGPWKPLRPLGTASFAIAEPAAAEPPPSAPAPSAVARATPPSFPPEAPPETTAPAPSPRSPESAGNIPPKGSLILRIKQTFLQARPLLHVLLLLGPTLAIACLTGWRGALALNVLLALGTEAGEFLFGYGFDRTDALDLALDAVGILLGLALGHGLRGWWRGFRNGNHERREKARNEGTLRRTKLSPREDTPSDSNL